MIDHDWRNSTFKVACIPCPNPLWFVRVILWRFVEITCRVFLLVLIWANLGGAALSIILTFETLICFFIACGYKSVEPLCLVMYISWTRPSHVEGTVYEKTHFKFLKYRFSSPFLYLFLVTIFATVDFGAPLVPAFEDRNGITVGETLGQNILIYAWVASCVWPSVLYIIKKQDVFGGFLPRDLMYYMKSFRYEQARSLIEFGAVTDQRARVLDVLSEEELYGGVPSPSFLSFLKYLCLKYPEQINEEHKLFPLERVVAEGGSVLHMAVISKAMRTWFVWYSSAVLSALLEIEMVDVNAVNAKDESALAVIAQRIENQSSEPILMTKNTQIVDVYNAAVLIEGGIDAVHKEHAKMILSGRDGMFAKAIAKLIDGQDVMSYLMFRRVYEEINWREFEKVVKELVQKMPDINAKDGFGNTLLHAVLGRMVQIRSNILKQIAENVLNFGADESITNAYGVTAKQLMDCVTQLDDDDDIVW